MFVGKLLGVVPSPFRKHTDLQECFHGPNRSNGFWWPSEKKKKSTVGKMGLVTQESQVTSGVLRRCILGMILFYIRAAVLGALRSISLRGMGSRR